MGRKKRKNSGKTTTGSSTDAELERLKEELEEAEADLASENMKYLQMKKAHKFSKKKHKYNLSQIKKEDKRNEKEHEGEMAKLETRMLAEQVKYEALSDEHGQVEPSVENKLKEEREKIQRLIINIHMLMEMQLARATVDNGGGPFDWKICEICIEEYTTRLNSFPVALACGHTICSGCMFKISEDHKIRCPFDRKDTQLNQVQINFTLLFLCD